MPTGTWAVVVPFAPLDETRAEVLEALVLEAYRLRRTVTFRLVALERDQALVGWVDRLAQAHALADWADNLHTRAAVLLGRLARGH